jgi:hypothetical protein
MRKAGGGCCGARMMTLIPREWSQLENHWSQGETTFKDMKRPVKVCAYERDRKRSIKIRMTLSKKGGDNFAVIPDRVGESVATECRWHSQTWLQSAFSTKED